VRLHHEFRDAAARDEHVQGWRFQLSLFANVVADEAHADAASLVDAWFAAWADADTASRDATLHRIASPYVSVRDRFSSLETIPELSAHIGAAQRFMAGVTMQRLGGVRHCQGVALADWRATGSDGTEKMRGTNVFVLGPSGRIESVTGLTGAGAS
jgi:hypothetical protein